MNTFNPKEIIEGINFEELKKHPNILIAARFWDDERYHAAKVCYKFMRKIDDLIDDRKADETILTDCEKIAFTEKVNDWINCLGFLEQTDPVFGEIASTVRRFKIPMQLFHNFARSMIFDINNNGFSTYEEFVEYAQGASVAPASVFVHLCCLNDDYSDYVMPNTDGFGLIAFASLFPMIFVMIYGMLIF